MNSKSGFTLVEILVAMALMSLIVLALMAVFNSTQKAFRAGLTQTDVLEGGRATMDLIASDLKSMSPSDRTNGMNFCVTNYNFYSSLNQLLIINPNQPTQLHYRTNILENLFILSRGNVNGSDSWIGTGYAIFLWNTNSDLYSLYRFSTNCSVMAHNEPEGLFYAFTNFLGIAPDNFAASTNYSHLIDGVVGFRVHPFGSNGSLIDGSFQNVITNLMEFSGEIADDLDYAFSSNALPASVEVEMSVLEDSAIQHTESLFVTNKFPWQNQDQWYYLTNSVGRVHVFRQRISIPVGLIPNS